MPEAAIVLTIVPGLMFFAFIVWGLKNAAEGWDFSKPKNTRTDVEPTEVGAP